MILRYFFLVYDMVNNLVFILCKCVIDVILLKWIELLLVINWLLLIGLGNNSLRLELFFQEICKLMVFFSISDEL